MLKSELAKKLSSNVATINQALRELGRTDLIPGKHIPDDLAKQFVEAASHSTGTQSDHTETTPPKPQQPAPGVGGALAETQGEQLQESRQKIEAILPDLDKLLLQKTAQSAVADADLNALVYQSVFDSRSTDNRLAFVQAKIGQLNHQQAAKLDAFDPYQTLADLGVTNPTQVYAAFCEYKRGLESPKNAQSVDIDSLGKQDAQARIEALKAIYTGN